jgi:hypothetical protein
MFVFDGELAVDGSQAVLHALEAVGAVGTGTADGPPLSFLVQPANR